MFYFVISEFSYREGIFIWCSVKNLHCNRFITCWHAELWTVLWHDWRSNRCLLYIWV